MQLALALLLLTMLIHLCLVFCGNDIFVEKITLNVCFLCSKLCLNGLRVPEEGNLMSKLVATNSASGNVT